MKNSILLNLILAILLCTIATTTKAQLDVKIDPIDIVLRNPKASIEYVVNRNIGVELVGGFRHGETMWRGWLTKRELHKGYNIRAVGKYYVNPLTRADGIYAAMYAGQKSYTTYSTNENETPYKVEGFTGGLMVGFKQIHETGFMLEVAGGVGRNFGYSQEHEKGKDVFGRVTVGYRF